jgi:hypothetical protein
MGNQVTAIAALLRQHRWNDSHTDTSGVWHKGFCACGEHSGAFHDVHVARKVVELMTDHGAT